VINDLIVDDSVYESNVVADWLTLLLHNREVRGSNLGPETGYPY
jgi:hypothetical protein